MFPSWEDLGKLWKSWKKSLWSTRPGDAIKAWGGILAAFSLLVVLMSGFGWFNTISTVILVFTTIKLTLNSVEKPEE
jgi:hypothetical protein